jgi:hypothetical protein
MEQVEIRIKGQIDKNWSDWLEGLSINYQQTERNNAKMKIGYVPNLCRG